MIPRVVGHQEFPLSVAQFVVQPQNIAFSRKPVVVTVQQIYRSRDFRQIVIGRVDGTVLLQIPYNTVVKLTEMVKQSVHFLTIVHQLVGRDTGRSMTHYDWQQGGVHLFLVESTREEQSVGTKKLGNRIIPAELGADLRQELAAWQELVQADQIRNGL